MVPHHLYHAPTHIDVYGGGEDLKDIKNAAMDAAVDLTFFPPTDHADPALRRYKVFVNPSRSEVLSTTTAEALAMGKFVVLERHPSNDFFVGFANALRALLRHDPEVLFVGEVRDAETARTAVEAGLTGHLVLTCPKMHPVVVSRAPQKKKAEPKPALTGGQEHGLLPAPGENL